MEGEDTASSIKMANYEKVAPRVVQLWLNLVLASLCVKYILPNTWGIFLTRSPAQRLMIARPYNCMEISLG